MISWWNNLGRKGKFYFWGFFSIGINGIFYLGGFWFPKAVFIGIGLVIIGFVIPDSWDD